MAYESWKKEGKLLSACRVVGLALEAIFKAEAQSGETRPSDCASVEFWKTQRLQRDGSWSGPETCAVAVLPIHQQLAFYIYQRVYQWIAGLGLCVVDAIVGKSRAEGCGHHDLKLKHGLVHGPRYCAGFMSVEVKVANVGPSGRKFQAAWNGYKEEVEAAMCRVLSVPGTAYGAAMLLMVGVCDDNELCTLEPPLLVKAQMLLLDSEGKPKWSSVLLDKGLLAITPQMPPAKASRKGASWDEVRAQLSNKWLKFGDVEYVRLLDLLLAISPNKTVKNPGQKVASYQKFVGLRQRVHYMQKKNPEGGRGSSPYWVNLAGAQAIYDYEVHGKRL
jgi:hypothetical protein